jgi:hypothetical protein
MKKLSELVIFIFFLFVCLPDSIYAQERAPEPGFHPYISVQEEYNDNINLTPTDKKDDYITTINPGLRYTNMGVTSGVNLDYSLGVVLYGKNTDLNYISHNGSLEAKYLTKEHLNFYLRDSFIRSEDNREYEYFTTTAENKFVLSTQTQRAVYWRNVVAPRVEYQFGREDRVGLNYINNIYRTDNTTSENSQENYINPFLDYWFDLQNGLHLEYGYDIGNFEKSADMTGHMAKARYTYRFRTQMSIFGEYAFTRREFDRSSSLSPGFLAPTSDYDIHNPSMGITYAFSPTFTALAQIGYFWYEPEIGSRIDGVNYLASITHRGDVRTIYVVSLQGGYTEDYFTSQNLGFNKYHRLTGSITHFLEKRLSVGLLGSIERVEFIQEDRNDWIWSVGGTVSYMPLKWLTLALEISHREDNSNVDIGDYTENRGLIRITATY